MHPADSVEFLPILHIPAYSMQSSTNRNKRAFSHQLQTIPHDPQQMDANPITKVCPAVFSKLSPPNGHEHSFSVALHTSPADPRMLKTQGFRKNEAI